MNDIPCEHNADAAGWVLGSLSPQEAERFAAHLETCASCRAEVAKLTEGLRGTP
jgi:anti-sigma factor RsiW